MSRIARKAVNNRWAYVLLGILTGTLLSLTLLATSGKGITQEQVDHDPQGAPYVAGELLVTYTTAEAPAATTESVPEEVDGEIKEEIPQLDTQLLEFPEVKEEPSEESREDLLEQKKEDLAQDPAVESVSFNYIFEGAQVPNDPQFKDQYGLRKPGFHWAWDEVRGNGVDIAIIDTGIAASHPDLQGKVIDQRNSVGDKESGVAADNNGHGTLVAGVAAAVTDNREGVAGACPECRILAAKVLDSNGRGTAADVTDGIVWATDNGAEIINLSFSAVGADVPTVKKAINDATDRGVVVVASSGNTGRNERVYPAAYSNVIAVGASNAKDQRASFSTFGGWVDVVAPGVGILSTKRPTGYGEGNGTSFSTSYVSGLAGLLAAQKHSASEIRSRIEGTAVDLGTKGKDRFYGYGRVDAAAAVGVERPPPNTAPRITAPKPRPGSKIKNRKPTMRAVVRDSETDLKRSHISLFVDKRNKKGFRYNRKTDMLTYAPPNKLATGRHSVKIVARDEQGRKTTKSWTFRVEEGKRASQSAGKRSPYGQGFPFRHLPKRFPFNIIT